MTHKELRHRLLELYGMSCAFKMLKTDSTTPFGEIQAAIDTGKNLQDGLRALITDSTLLKVD